MSNESHTERCIASDADDVALCAAQSDAFLERAMTEWGDVVYRLALSHTRSRADAEDVYQDVFLRLYSCSAPFFSSEHVKAWLLRVTINRCRDLARSSWKRRTVEFDPNYDAPEQACGADADAAVWNAVGQLPESWRMAVHLHYVDGYPTEDVSRILGCSPSTARTWLFRARARVKELLEDASTASSSTADPARAPHSKRSEGASTASPIISPDPIH